MEKKILRSKRVRVQTHSRICNLMFENFVRGKLSEYDEAERLHRAYGAWIASVCERGLGTASAAAFEEAEPAGIEEFIEGLRESAPDSVEEIRSTSSGTIAELDTDGRRSCELRYDESALLGTDCETVVVFDDGAPGRITVYRTGPSGSAFCFDRYSPRMTSMYATPHGQIALGIITHRVHNSLYELLDGGSRGEMVIDYTLEMGGAATEYSHMHLTAVEQND